MLFTYDDYLAQLRRLRDATDRAADFVSRSRFDTGDVSYAMGQLDTVMEALGVMQVQLREKKQHAATPQKLFG